MDLTLILLFLIIAIGIAFLLFILFYRAEKDNETSNPKAEHESNDQEPLLEIELIPSPEDAANSDAIEPSNLEPGHASAHKYQGTLHGIEAKKDQDAWLSTSAEEPEVRMIKEKQTGTYHVSSFADDSSELKDSVPQSVAPDFFPKSYAADGNPYCPYCGAPIKPGDKFCVYCGHAL